MKKYLAILLSIILISCGDKKTPAPTPTPVALRFKTITFNGLNYQSIYSNADVNPTVRITFTTPVDKTSVASAISISSPFTGAVNGTYTYENDSTILVTPAAPLQYLSKYNFTLSQTLKSVGGTFLVQGSDFTFYTKVDPTPKFPIVTDSALLDIIQRQTFKYFWDWGHPVSGLSRERQNSGDLVTSGGSGFGIMSILVAIKRGFITRAEGLTRMQTIVTFLKTKAEKNHGAFSHWLNGNTGAVMPFSTKDNGADLVETSYLIQGLLCARQYFTGSNTEETNLRSDINNIWNGVEWSWFRRDGQNVLYWHWSPTYNWDMNMQIRGWNECLITYILAASSSTYGVPKEVYTNGFAANGNMRNGNNFYGINLPLGSSYGGPLFFAHYSFLGVNPKGLSDTYADYFTQVKNHTLINYTHCKTNPTGYMGYSDSCWGLTASDIPNGYSASSPTNDKGIIAPTAALSSMPYTPNESIAALKYFYYSLGDKIFKEYGFVDAFSLNELWFANSFLAIDQGPIIIMIENYRSGFLWNLFTSCPEVKTGMKAMGFTAPYL